LAALTILLCCFLAEPCQSATLTHRYSFAIDATDSIAGANGVLEGNAIIGPSGMLILDGTNSYVQLPSGLFTNYGSASFEIWYADTPVNGTNAELFYFANISEASSIYYNLGGQGVFDNRGVSTFVTLATPAAGGTNHVVLSMDTNVLTGSLFVNGALGAVKSNFTSGAALQLVTNIILGGNGTKSTNFNFRGTIIEFRSYSNALSSLELAMTDALGPGQPLTNAGSLLDVRVALPSTTGPGAIFRAGVFADFAFVSNVNISTQPDLVMMSDNPAAISVGADGRLTTVAFGSANITAVWQGMSNTVPVTIAVPDSFTLLHRYSFNEQAGDFIVHDSVGSANGTTVGPLPTDLTFTGTNGLKMNGYPSPFTGYAALPSPMISDLSEVSIEAWVTWTPGQVALGYGSGAWQRICDFGNDPSASGQTYLYLTPATDNVSFTTNSVLHCAITTNTLFHEAPRESWTKFLPTNVLSFVALTYSPSRGLMNMYLNGALVTSGTAVIPLSGIVDSNCWLGRSQFSSDAYFNGIFREFRVYSGFLSDSDVAQDYAAGQNVVTNAWPGPELSTLAATEISDTLGTLEGMVRPNGQDTQVFFQFGPTTNYGITTAVTDIGSGINRVMVPALVDGLTPLSVYHFRCVASNATLMFYGSDLSFTTTNTIIILPATGVGGPTAALNGGFALDGQPFDAFFEYGTTTNYGNLTAIVPVVATNSFVDVSASISNLLINTTYYYRLVVTNQNTTLLSPSASLATGPLIPFYAIGIGSGKIFYADAQLTSVGTYAFQWSSNLVNWTTIESVEVTGLSSLPASESFSDNAAATQRARFFRLYRP
jgi:hypothetical protein